MKFRTAYLQSLAPSFTLPLLVALFLAACNQTAPDPALTPNSGPAPLYNLGKSERIPGSYIVVMKPGVQAQAAASSLGSLQRAVTQTYTMPGFQGFALDVSDEALKELQNNPNVAYVEADARLSVSQTATTWGQDRIDERQLPLDGLFNRGGNTGSGVRAYVIDTGIRGTHREFGGRVGKGYSAISDGQGTNDCQGHGTHVAGTLGGVTFGVANKVSLVPVRVLDCEGFGSVSDVIAGVNWVTNNATLPAVANMSLGAPFIIESLTDAVEASISKGITYVVAAGNDNSNACDSSPANVPAAITVGASTVRDDRAGFSNYGSCIDLFAPGESVDSAWFTSDTATATLSGTSMAAPHVAGAVALLGAPKDAATRVAGCSTRGVVNSARSTNNHLLYVLCTSAPNPSPAPARYTVNFSGLARGTLISSVTRGRGIMTTTGTISDRVVIYGRRKDRSGNVALLTGSARYLILSRDGKSQTGYGKGGTIDFKFANFGTGKVSAKTIKVRNTTTQGGTIKLYRGSTLLKRVVIPRTGVGVVRTLTLNTANTTLVKVTLTGLGAVDDLSFEASQ